MTFTEEQNIFCVMRKLEANSYKHVIAKLGRKYDKNKTPSKTDIYRWIKKFEATGTINDMRKKSSAVKVGRKPTARSTENIAAVRDSVGRSPKKSVRRRSQDLGLNKSSVQRGRGVNRVQRGHQWYQQDGATPHTANVSLMWLDQKFPNRLITCKCIPPTSTPQMFICGDI